MWDNPPTRRAAQAQARRNVNSEVALLLGKGLKVRVRTHAHEHACQVACSASNAWAAATLTRVLPRMCGGTQRKIDDAKL